jgi:putative transposase
LVLHEVPSFHSNYSIGEVVRKFKSLAAWELFKSFLGLGTELWGGEFWTDKYYAATVGERQLDSCRKIRQEPR